MKIICDILKVNWIPFKILDKFMSCLWKLELEFWTGPKLVFRCHTRTWRYIVTFSMLIEVLLVKIGVRFLDSCLGKYFRPNWPKTIFWVPDPKYYIFIMEIIFNARFNKIIHIKSLYFQILNDIGWILAKILNFGKKHQEYSFWFAIPSMQSSFKFCLLNHLFL